jgi:hypothetical protein
MMRLIPMVLLLAAGCGGGQASPSPEKDPECRAGAAESCACPSGTDGTRTCSSGGTWGSCACPSSLSCVKTGDSATTATTCCTKELDAFGKCCDGIACCNARNHSGAEGASCVCNAGYAAPASFSTLDRRCAAAPDLEVSAFGVTYWEPGTWDSNMWLCLNREPDGSSSADGAFVEVTNGGSARAGAFGVALGIQYISSGKFFYGTPVLVDADGVSAGFASRWDGPVCVGFSVANLPAGAYRVGVMADIDHVVTESDETNNLATGTDTFLID